MIFTEIDQRSKDASYFDGRLLTLNQIRKKKMHFLARLRDEAGIVADVVRKVDCLRSPTTLTRSIFGGGSDIQVDVISWERKEDR